MNKVLKAVAGAMCAMTVLFTGVTVFADEDKKTPTGIAYKDSRETPLRNGLMSILMNTCPS